MKRKNIIIMGAAGRDYENFLIYFKDNPEFNVVAFTQAQIPGIEKRKFPKELAGRLYKHDIPFYPEEKLPELIKKFKIDYVYLCYSDLSHQEVMAKASLVLANGASFALLGTNATYLKSKKPVISVCATRTGAGKGTTCRKILSILKENEIKAVIIRHPMPYSKNLLKEVCQRYSSLKDLDKYETTLEEQEEYLPYLEKGYIVYAGVDYKKIISEAEEEEADVIVYEGGNNDFSFFKSDLYITVVDPLRKEGLYSYPGEVNVLLADVIIVNKSDLVTKDELNRLVKEIKKINNKAEIIIGKSDIKADKEMIKNKNVVLVEDSPSITHGGVSSNYTASKLAAKKYKSKNIINPRRYGVGSLKEVFKDYPNLDIIPTTGYGKSQINDLIETINNVKADSIIFASYCSLFMKNRFNKPLTRVTYELEEIGKPKLDKIIFNFLKNRIH